MNTNYYQSPFYLPGGVADADGKIGYFSNGNQGVDAINLTTGICFWKNELGTYPLIVRENSLVALRFVEADKHSIQIVVIAFDQGALPLLISQPIKFPDWVKPKKDDESFLFRVYLDQNILIFRWKAWRLYKGGAPPPSFVSSQKSGQNSGEIRFNLNNGNIERLPLMETNEFEAEKSTAAREDGLFEIEAWKINAEIASLLLDVSKSLPAIYLQTRDSLTGQTFGLTRLIEGNGLVHKITLDGLYVLVGQEVESPAAQVSSDLWNLFLVETGEKVALLNFERGIQEVSIIGSNIFYTVEERDQTYRKLILKAKKIATDTTLWEYLLSSQPDNKPPALYQ